MLVAYSSSHIFNFKFYIHCITSIVARNKHVQLQLNVEQYVVKKNVEYYNLPNVFITKCVQYIYNLMPNITVLVYPRCPRKTIFF